MHRWVALVYDYIPFISFSGLKFDFRLHFPVQHQLQASPNTSISFCSFCITNLAFIVVPEAT